MIVLDASALVAYLRRRPPDVADAIRRRILSPGESLHVPHLLDLEVASVLRRSVQRGELTPADAVLVLEALADSPLVRYPHWPLMQRVWELRHNLTPYDAVYVALAEALEAPLVTLDARIARASGHQAQVETF